MRKNLYILSYLLFTLVCSSPLRAEEQPTLGLYFRIPPCLPHCAASDKPSLNQNSFIENQVISAIDMAKNTIDFQQFTFSRPSVFYALIRAADRGVTVRGIVDAAQFSRLKNECSAKGCTFDAPYVSQEILEKKPSERLAIIKQRNLWPDSISMPEKLAILFYQLPNGSGVKPQSGKGRLMHNKFVLVDQNLLVNGSGNWSSTGMGINLENIHVMDKTSHPREVEAFSCLSLALWPATGTASGLRGCELNHVLFSPSPNSNGNSVLSAILQAIKLSTQTIEISMHHLVHQDIINSLIDAASRGVRVKIMLDDDDCILRRDENMMRMLDAGIEVQYMPTDCNMFQLSHNKFGIFDRKSVINGSGNWSKSGLHNNYENFTIYSNPSEVGSFSSFFDQAWPMTQKHEECFCQRRDPECRAKYCLGRRL